MNLILVGFFLCVQDEKRKIRTEAFRLLVSSEDHKWRDNEECKDTLLDLILISHQCDTSVDTVN